MDRLSGYWHRRGVANAALVQRAADLEAENERLRERLRVAESELARVALRDELDRLRTGAGSKLAAIVARLAEKKA